jgi:vacuolar-type H+-ATPase subunit I/STV1
VSKVASTAVKDVSNSSDSDDEEDESKVASTAVKDVSNSSDSDDEEDESKVAKVSSQSDEASEIEEKPAKEINKKDIDRLLDQIMSGKKENIDDLEAAQKSVLKCFGLIA